MKHIDEMVMEDFGLQSQDAFSTLALDFEQEMRWVDGPMPPIAGLSSWLSELDVHSPEFLRIV